MSHLKSGYEKKIIAYCITVIILLILAALIYFLYFINQDIEIRILGSIVIMLILGIWFYLERRITKQLENTVYESDIKRFVLITRDGERQKEWCCKGACSFLIGKSSINHEVDIDLADTYYMEYVSPSHAVLNYVQGYWYIEDLNSTNGVGLKKRGEEYALRLKPMTSYKVEEGDVIYISKVKLLAR
ncbi:MAG TPA: FHA domain-containing protein [Candidatus Coprocola pullicola]|nr:FHA domain-containing protein [Candidatus Coprocola pullicola]